MAYLEFVRSGGRTYVYINEYVGDQEFSAKKEIRIASLGRAEQALMMLKMWQVDQNLIPKDINGVNHTRLSKWIETVKKRATF